jgi:hypothetical protein
MTRLTRIGYDFAYSTGVTSVLLQDSVEFVDKRFCPAAAKPSVAR